MISFRMDVFNNEYLPDGSTDVDALLTVCADDDGAGDEPRNEYAEVIIIDCSGSMSVPPTKIYAARRAAAAAVDCLRPDTLFAVIRGTGVARVVYPPDGGLARATTETREEAKRQINRMAAEGGTAIGRWLHAARDLLARHPDAIRHAILLTDGKNEHETATEFAAALDACRGHFQCDSRGIGRGWVAAELSAVSDALLGTARDIPDPAELVEDFRAMTDAAMARALREVSLRVWIPRGARISVFKQVHPTLDDLLERGPTTDGQESEFRTGAWGAGCRDYHLTVSGLRPNRMPRPSRLARVAVMSGGRRLASGSVQARWTADAGPHTHMSQQVQHSRSQIELNTAINLGTAALRGGDDDGAVAHLGRAMRLARATRDHEKVDMLAWLVDVDAATGELRIRPDVDQHLLEVVDVRSRFTQGLEPRGMP